MLNITFVHDTFAIAFGIFSSCVLMVLVLGEQNCKSHGAFKPNVNIEDATCREQPFERFQGAHKHIKNQ